jgi:hypothetical protein
VDILFKLVHLKLKTNHLAMKPKPTRLPAGKKRPKEPTSKKASKKLHGKGSQKTGSRRKRAVSSESDDNSDTSEDTPDVVQPHSQKKRKIDEEISDDCVSDIEEVELVEAQSDQVLS